MGTLLQDPEPAEVRLPPRQHHIAGGAPCLLHMHELLHLHPQMVVWSGEMPTPPPAFFRQRCVCGVVRELSGDAHGKALSQRPSLLAAVATGTSTSAGVIAALATLLSSSIRFAVLAELLGVAALGERARPTTAMGVDRRSRSPFCSLSVGRCGGTGSSTRNEQGNQGSRLLPTIRAPQFLRRPVCARHFETWWRRGPIGQAAYCGVRRKYRLSVSSCCW